MKINQLLYLLLLKAKRYPNPLINAQKYRFKGLDIGHETWIYGNCHLDTSQGSKICIGSKCVLTGCTILAHDAALSTHGYQTYFKKTIIGNQCFIGWQAIILAGVNIADNCIVGAGSVVTHDIPFGCVVAGNPAKVIGTVEQLIQKRKTCLNKTISESGQD